MWVSVYRNCKSVTDIACVFAECVFVPENQRKRERNVGHVSVCPKCLNGLCAYATGARRGRHRERSQPRIYHDGIQVLPRAGILLPGPRHVHHPAFHGQKGLQETPRRQRKADPLLRREVRRIIPDSRVSRVYI